MYVGNSDEPTANTVCAANQPANSAANPLVEVTCTTPVAGSSLYIYLPRQGVLTLCEVEVIGRECLTGESEIPPQRVCESFVSVVGVVPCMHTPSERACRMTPRDLFSDLCTDMSSVSHLKFKYMLIFVYVDVYFWVCMYIMNEKWTTWNPCDL